MNAFIGPSIEPYISTHHGSDVKGCRTLATQHVRQLSTFESSFTHLIIYNPVSKVNVGNLLLKLYIS